VVHTLIHPCQVSSQIQAHLIGDGPDRTACEQLVHQAGLTGRIHFHGRIPPEQVQPLLQRSQAILLMSDFEGLPVALLEAMAAGVVPVVRAIESGIPELVHHEHTGLLVGNDPAEAAAALVRLSREPDLWQRCSTQSRALVEGGYGADQCFERWLGVMVQLRGPARPPFPIRTAGLRRLLPLTDARFQSHYAPPPSRWSRLHPRRMLGRLKRSVDRYTRQH
jgi:glycosyltransferase involved in cell wall biosynthesis